MYWVTVFVKLLKYLQGICGNREISHLMMRCYYQKLLCGPMSIFQTQWLQSLIFASPSLSLNQHTLCKAEWMQPATANSQALSSLPWSKYSCESFLCRPNISVQSSAVNKKNWLSNPWAFFKLSLTLSPLEWKWLFLAPDCEFLLRCPMCSSALSAVLSELGSTAIIELANTETQWHLGMSTLIWRGRGLDVERD